MRQIELELVLDEAEQVQSAIAKVDRKTHEEVVALVAEAIIALIESARGKEADSEPAIQP